MNDFDGLDVFVTGGLGALGLRSSMLCWSGGPVPYSLGVPSLPHSRPAVHVTGGVDLTNEDSVEAF